MKKHFNLKHSLALTALLALPAAHAATLTKADYNEAKARIAAAYQADKSACGTLAGNARDVCALEATAKEKVALAELEYTYTGKPADQNKVLVVKAETAYDVAKDKCDDLSGNPKDVCVKEAKAAEVKALADAKVARQIGEAKTDAAADKRDADYKVAAEKCDALAGDTKARCVADAKARFGKS